MYVFFKNILLSPLGKNTSILTAGTLISQCIGISITPILSRIYLPADYGLLALFSAFVAICSTIITMRYETRIVIPKSEKESKSILELAICISIFLGAVLVLLTLFFVTENLLRLMSLTELSPWIIYAILSSIATAIIGIISNWLNRASKYRTISTFRILQASFGAIAGLGFGILMIQDGLIYAQMLGLFLTLIIFISFGYPSIGSKPNFSEMLESAKIHKNAPIYLLPTAVVDIVTMQLPFFLITVWFSNEVTGNYRMAYSLLLMPMSLIGASIAQVFFKSYSNLWPDAAAAKKMLLNTWKTLAIIGFLPLITIIFFGEQIFEIALGEAWGQAGQIASILAPMVFASLIHSPTSSTLTVMGMERLGFYIALTAVFYRPLSFYIGYLYNDFHLGLALFSGLEIMHFFLFQILALNNINKTLRLAKSKTNMN